MAVTDSSHLDGSLHFELCRLRVKDNKDSLAAGAQVCPSFHLSDAPVSVLGTEGSDLRLRVRTGRLPRRPTWRQVEAAGARRVLQGRRVHLPAVLDVCPWEMSQKGRAPPGIL